MKRTRKIDLTLPSLISWGDGINPNLSNSDAFETTGSFCILYKPSGRADQCILGKVLCLPCYSNNLSTFDVICDELKYLSACNGLQEIVAHLQIIWLAVDDDVLMFRTDTTVP